MSAVAGKPVTESYISDLSRVVGTGVRFIDPAPSRNGALLEGDYRLTLLRPGMYVHASDTWQQSDVNSEFVKGSGLSCYLFLDGDVDFSIGGRPFRLGRHGSDMEAVLVASTRPEICRRRSARGAHIRKVAVSISDEWLETCCGGELVENRALLEFAGNHLAERRWKPSIRLVSAAEQILHPPEYAPALQALYLESRALEILTEALLAVSAETAPAPGGGDAGAQMRLRHVCAFLDAHFDEQLSLGEIAQEAGVSPTTLQRLFQAAHGMSVFDYLRARKLERARQALERDGVSVTEAAFIAGYSSPSNFATAFKRRFGMSPKNVRARL